MSLEAICFDLDDTLYDYLRYAKLGLDEVGDYLEALTGREYHAELYDMYFEDGITENTFELLVERHDLSPELVSEMEEAYHGATDPLEPYPETEPVLSELAETYELGCITDGREGHTKLRRLGIREYFDEVLVTSTIGRSKREASVFEYVLSKLSTEPAAAVYVGADPWMDFHNPNDLGMTTVRLRKGRYSDLEPTTRDAVPDHEIPTLEELPNVLDTIERLGQSVSSER